MKLIKKAAKTEIVRNVGDVVIVEGYDFDGRTTRPFYTKGTITKINRITLDIEDAASGAHFRFDPRKDRIVTEQEMIAAEKARKNAAIYTH